MAVEIKMPALSPTMEEGTLARWLVKVGDTIQSGDIMAEIETDKATMEFEAVDEGVLTEILIEAGTDNVKVGTVIARLAMEGEEDAAAPASAPAPQSERLPASEPAPVSQGSAKGAAATPVARRMAEQGGVDLASLTGTGPRGKIIKDDVTAALSGNAANPPQPSVAVSERVIASPLARRMAADKGFDIAAIAGTGPGGRVIGADVAGFTPASAPAAAPAPAASEAPSKPKPSAAPEVEGGAPFTEDKLSNVRKVIARRLTESKQTVPHFYLTVDIRLDPLLKLRSELNVALEPDGVKLSVNDFLIKALARALIRVPQCNVSFHGDTLRRYERADVSVAVAAPSGLITPVITEADTKSLAVISNEMKALAGKAREGKLMPHEYQGGTASLSNLGMFGIMQFDAVINPPQGMILAVGAGQQAPYVVDGELAVATVMHASGSFDHRAIDGADGAQLMEAIKQLVENPMGLVV
jgi:pyruvate dehydrogenase E2 component (dihydrolipoamide acetyltransferase)